MEGMVFPESIQAICFFFKKETTEPNKRPKLSSGSKLILPNRQMIAEGLQPDYHDKTDQSGLKNRLIPKKTTLFLTRDTLLFHGIPFTEGSLHNIKE